MRFTGKKAIIVFKWLATVIPAFGVLYFGLSQVWSLPFGQEITASCGLVTTFLMVAVGISKPEESQDGPH